MDWRTCSSNGVATISCIPIIILNFIYWGILLSGSIAVIVIIIGGIRFLVSGGDPKKLDQARKTIAFAVLGLVLVMLSFFIIKFMGSVTGVGCIDTTSFEFSFRTCG